MRVKDPFVIRLNGMDFRNSVVGIEDINLENKEHRGCLSAIVNQHLKNLLNKTHKKVSEKCLRKKLDKWVLHELTESLSSIFLKCV